MINEKSLQGPGLYLLNILLTFFQKIEIDPETALFLEENTKINGLEYPLLFLGAWKIKWEKRSLNVPSFLKVEVELPVLNAMHTLKKKPSLEVEKKTENGGDELFSGDGQFFWTEEVTYWIWKKNRREMEELFPNWQILFHGEVL